MKHTCNTKIMMKLSSICIEIRINLHSLISMRYSVDRVLVFVIVLEIVLEIVITV